MLAGRLLGNRGEIELSRTELGLTLNSRSATLELSALRLGITLGAYHTPTESCVVSHLVLSKKWTAIIALIEKLSQK